MRLRARMRREPGTTTFVTPDLIRGSAYFFTSRPDDELCELLSNQVNRDDPIRAWLGVVETALLDSVERLLEIVEQAQLVGAKRRCQTIARERGAFRSRPHRECHHIEPAQGC